MKSLIVAALCVLVAGSAEADPWQVPWASCSLAVRPEFTVGPTAVYVWGAGDYPAANVPQVFLWPDQWHTIDLADIAIVDYNLPTETKAIYLGGLIGSTGVSNIYCGMTASFRAPGSTLNAGSYQIQGVASLPSGAYRETVGLWVPVVDRKFEFLWHCVDAACPMFLKLDLQAHCR